MPALPATSPGFPAAACLSTTMKDICANNGAGTVVQAGSNLERLTTSFERALKTM
jgi:hypothetical protein